MNPPTHRGRLTRHGILDAAVAIADAEGLAAVTMRRVAADLDAEAMSLYHHVPGKQALLDGLADAVMAEIEEAVGAGERTAGPWADDLKRRCLTARTVMLRHPWAPRLLSALPAMPASVFASFEAVLATLIGGGFSYHLAHQAIHALGSMALGYSQEPFSPAGETGAAGDVGDAEAIASTFPHTAAMIAAELHDDNGTLGWCDSQAEFEFALDLLIDGLSRRRDLEAS